jgi:hypothetical protein
VESSCEFGIEPSGSMSVHTTRDLSSSAQHHESLHYVDMGTVLGIHATTPKD